MYTPKHFREDDLATLHTLMRDYNFAILVTQRDGIPQATHLPFILDSTRGPYGTLYTHMARANQQWRDFAEMEEVLVIFQGPHTYITPSWYQPGLYVPTWNYTAIHAYGKPRIIEDTQEMHTLMQQLTQQSEARFEHQWQFDSLPIDFVDKKLRATVCIEMEIARLEGKAKLSQDRSEVDRQHIVAKLKESIHVDDIEVGRLMEELHERARS